MRVHCFIKITNNDSSPNNIKFLIFSIVSISLFVYDVEDVEYNHIKNNLTINIKIREIGRIRDHAIVFQSNIQRNNIRVSIQP